MIQIAKVPYRKIYSFHYFSDAMWTKIILYALALILPFFMVYSVNNFYLSYIPSISTSTTTAFTNPNLKLKYPYTYHLTITTSNSIYTYTTLYDETSLHQISFSYENNENQLTHTFTINWMKPISQRVKKVSIAIFMDYQTVNTNGQGIIFTQSFGYDLAEVVTIGKMKVKTGLNSLNNPPSSTAAVLVQNNYNIGLTQLALQQSYNSYLQSSTQSLTLNMPNNLFKYVVKLKTPTLTVQEKSASVLGQLIWSLMQYFPIACVFFFAVKWILSWMFKQGILAAKVIHDKF